VSSLLSLYEVIRREVEMVWIYFFLVHNYDPSKVGLQSTKTQSCKTFFAVNYNNKFYRVRSYKTIYDIIYNNICIILVKSLTIYASSGIKKCYRTESGGLYYKNITIVNDNRHK